MAYQLYVGIDVAADSFTGAWLVPGGKPVAPYAGEQTAAGFAALDRRLRAAAAPAAGTLIVMEATGNCSVALAVAPRPAPASAFQAHRQVIVLHRTVRKIVYPAASVPATAPPVRYLYVGGGSVSSGSTATTRCSGC